MLNQSYISYIIYMLYIIYQIIDIICMNEKKYIISL